MTLDWHFFHGWGFNSSFWNPLVNQIKSGKIKIHDRGYYGTPSSPGSESGNSEFRIIVTHSLGLFFVNELLLKSADLLVIVSGFQTFHKKEVQKAATQTMRSNLQKNPRDQLEAFMEACFYPDLSVFEIPNTPNTHRLSDDLLLIDSATFNYSTVYGIKNILILHGREDRIVPWQHAIELSSELPQAKVVLDDKGGHALPYTNPDWCLSQLRTVTNVN